MNTVSFHIISICRKEFDPKMILFQFVVLAAIAQSSYGRSFKSEENVLLESIEEEKEANQDLVPHHRTKRGWGSILLYGTAITLKVGTAGLTLGTLVQDGCNLYPSICTDRDAINKINGEIKEMKKKYDAEYIKSAEAWVTLRDGNNNNGYIDYYINNAKKGVTTLVDEQKALSTKLFTKVPILFKRFLAASKNVSSEEYLKTLVQQEEVSLNEINAIIKAQKDNELIGLFAQFLVEGALDVFMSSYKKSFREIKASMDYGNKYGRLLTAAILGDHRDAAILLNPDHPDHKAALRRHGLKTDDITTFDKVKLAPKVLKGMFENAGIWINNAKTSAKITFNEWKSIDSWDGFKSKLSASLEGPKRAFRAMKSFVFDANSRKYTVGNFKLDFSTKIMSSLGIIFDVVMTAVSVQEWKTVRDKIAEAKLRYEDYKAQLQNQLKKIADEQSVMNAQWTNITENFKELSKPFNDVINKASKHAVFAKVLGHPGLPVKPNNPISKVNLTSLDKSNILPTQQAYIDFLKKFDNNLKAIKEEVNARDILYTSVQEKTNKNEQIQEIEKDILGIFKVSSSSILKNFGKSLSKKDVVCTTAVLQIEKDEYDFYKLPPFRPICDVSQAAFDTMETEVSKRRNKRIMDTTVLLEAKKSASTLVSILNTVKLAYSVQTNQALKTYGTTITKQDIACSIATQFPNKRMFDYIDLTRFRPSCNAVTKSDFDKMLADTTRLRDLDQKVGGLLNSCTVFNTCPCISQIATAYKASEAEVKESIKRVKPQMTKYCSSNPQCNGCTDL